MIKKLFFTISVAFIFLFIFSRKNNELIVKAQDSKVSYYVPRVMIDLEENSSSKYFLLTGPYEQPYSFEHLRSQHWWIGIFGTYFVVEDNNITENLVCFEYTPTDKSCYVPSVFTADLYEDKIKNLHIVAETDFGDVEVFMNKVNLKNASPSSSIKSEYEELKMNLY